MNALFSFRIALRALSANKLRAGLTMLGMIIGVGAVIAMVSVGKGAQTSVTSQIESMGTNLLFIRPGAQQPGGIAQQQGTRPTLTYEDSVAIADDTSLPIVAVAPEQSTFAQVIARGTNVNTRVLGTTPEYSTVRNVKTASGDFITKQNLDSKSLVAVLGSSVATTLFGEEDPDRADDQGQHSGPARRQLPRDRRAGVQGRHRLRQPGRHDRHPDHDADAAPGHAADRAGRPERRYHQRPGDE